MSYFSSDMTLWAGRVDEPTGPETARWHQIITALDPAAALAPARGINFAFLGFHCDEGIRRNKGRPGAAQAPAALRRALSNLPVPFNSETKLFDAGDIRCENGDLESAQRDLAEHVHNLKSLGLTPIVLGGGHEVAFGHYAGLREALQNGPRKKRLGIVNFDAHFDLRPYGDGAHSGSPFLQIAELNRRNGEDFSYLCLGIQKSANTRHLFRTAQELGVVHVPGLDLNMNRFDDVKRTVDAFLTVQDSVYLTFCLDVIAAAFAPGVSAPTPHGIFPDIALSLVNHVAASGKVVGFDVAELSPPLDHDDRTAKLAAAMIFEFVTAFGSNSDT